MAKKTTEKKTKQPSSPTPDAGAALFAVPFEFDAAANEAALRKASAAADRTLKAREAAADAQLEAAQARQQQADVVTTDAAIAAKPTRAICPVCGEAHQTTAAFLRRYQRRVEAGQPDLTAADEDWFVTHARLDARQALRQMQEA